MTQDVSSMVAPRFPLIWAKATLTIEVSINSMMAAETVVMTMMALAKPCTGPDILIYLNFYIDTQPGFQGIFIAGFVDQFNFYRHALSYFYKVAGGVIWGKQRKLSPGGQTERRNLPANMEIRIPVQSYFYLLAFFHFFQLCFFEIGHNPKLIVVHHGKQGLSGLHVLSYFQTEFTDATIRGGIEMTIREPKPRLIERSFARFDQGFDLLNLGFRDRHLRRGNADLVHTGRVLLTGNVVIRAAVFQLLLCDSTFF